MSQHTADQRLADFQAIPVIDIYDILHGDAAARQTVADSLGHAAREVGFFQMVGHGIDQSLREGLIRQAKRFFAQSSDTKMQRYIGRYHHHAGDHLYAQTIQTFRYLRERLTKGEIALPEGARELDSLGQHGKHKDNPL